MSVANTIGPSRFQPFWRSLCYSTVTAIQRNNLIAVRSHSTRKRLPKRIQLQEWGMSKTDL